MDNEWSKKIFSAPFIKRLEAMAERKVANRSDEAVAYVLEKLAADNWKKCREYKGDSALDTFLFKICANSIIDFNRSIEGRKRAPKWLQQKGALWLAIWKDLCLARNDREWVIQHHSGSGIRDRHSINNIIDLIRAKLPWCGVSSREESLDDENFHQSGELACDMDDPFEGEEQEQNFLFAHHILQEDNEIDPVPDAAPNTIFRILRSIKLTPQEKLILRLRFCEGYSFEAIAQNQKMAKHQVDRLIKKILENLKVQLENLPTKPLGPGKLEH